MKIYYGKYMWAEDLEKRKVFKYRSGVKFDIVAFDLKQIS